MSKWKKVAPEEKEKLAVRLRAALVRQKGVTEKRMFGGVCFLVRGNMLCGTGSGDFLFRVGKEAHSAALARAGARPMKIGGRTMQGFIWVDPAACNSRSMKAWIGLAASYVGKLPPKRPR